MTEQIFRSMLARLTANAALMEAEVRADPLPFLRRAVKEMAALHKVLIDVETALNDTNWVWDEAAKINMPADLYQADTARVGKAREVLSRWMSGREA